MSLQISTRMTLLLSRLLYKWIVGPPRAARRYPPLLREHAPGPCHSRPGREALLLQLDDRAVTDEGHDDRRGVAVALVDGDRDPHDHGAGAGGHRPPHRQVTAAVLVAERLE